MVHLGSVPAHCDDNGSLSGFFIFHVIAHVVQIQHGRAHQSGPRSRQQPSEVPFTSQQKSRPSNSDQSKKHQHHQVAQTPVAVWIFARSVAVGRADGEHTQPHHGQRLNEERSAPKCRTDCGKTATKGQHPQGDDGAFHDHR